MQLYINSQATPEQRAIVQDYIMDDASRFDALINIMRLKAMRELDIDPADDFLPDHLQQCAPAACFTMHSFPPAPELSAQAPDEDYSDSRLPNTALYACKPPKRKRTILEILKEKLLCRTEDRED